MENTTVFKGYHGLCWIPNKYLLTIRAPYSYQSTFLHCECPGTSAEPTTSMQGRHGPTLKGNCSWALKKIIINHCQHKYYICHTGKFERTKIGYKLKTKFGMQNKMNKLHFDTTRHCFPVGVNTCFFQLLELYFFQLQLIKMLTSRACRHLCITKNMNGTWWSQPEERGHFHRSL